MKKSIVLLAVFLLTACGDEKGDTNCTFILNFDQVNEAIRAGNLTPAEAAQAEQTITDSGDIIFTFRQCSDESTETTTTTTTVTNGTEVL